MAEEITENVQMQPEETGQVSDQFESGNSETSQDNQENEASRQSDSEARNFVEMRKKLEREQREKEELRRKNEEAMEIIRNIEAQKRKQEEAPEEPIPEINLGDDDDLVDYKTVKAILAQQKRLEKQLRENEKKSYQMTAEARLKANYPDWEKVISDENLERLKQEDPDLMASIQYNPDPYSQYAAAYKAIKRQGIYKEDKYVADRQRAEQNANKPRPLTSVNPQQGDSPLSKANAFANAPLTEELKKKYWREMQEAMKRS